MNVQKLEKILSNCDLFELFSIQEIISHLIKEAEVGESDSSETDEREKRKENRFKSDIVGTLIRLTDVKPGERKEYNVHINDLSRNGMRLEVDHNFIPSRLVEIIFNRPGGSVKRCNLEVVRIRKMRNENGSWLELGCRSVSNILVRRLRIQEQQVLKMQHKLQNKQSIIIVLIGPNTKETREIETLLETEGYHVRHHENVQNAFDSARKISASLILFSQGSQFCKDKNLMSLLSIRPEHTAALAIVEKEEHRFPLFKAGVDECLTTQTCKEFLLYGIERALVTHSIRQSEHELEFSLKALIISRDNSHINHITYFLEKNGYLCKIVSSLEQAQKIKEEYTLVFTDFGGNLEELLEMRDYFKNLKLIALCDEIKQGYQAMANGANNYLSMPPNDEDIRMVLDSCKLPV
jgi:DNA-binding response OmpR family regulator